LQHFVQVNSNYLFNANGCFERGYCCLRSFLETLTVVEQHWWTVLVEDLLWLPRWCYTGYLSGVAAQSQLHCTAGHEGRWLLLPIKRLQSRRQTLQNGRQNPERQRVSIIKNCKIFISVLYSKWWSLRRPEYVMSCNYTHCLF
jgi:hypothetical protein